MKGATSGSMGPPPNPNARRRGPNGASNFALVRLPARREGPIPPIPYPHPTTHEINRWEELWRMPQAILWEQQKLEPIVGVYVRWWCRGLYGNNVTEALKAAIEARQMEDRLLLSPLMLFRARVEIAADEVAEARAVAVETTSTRRRLAAVDSRKAG